MISIGSCARERFHPSPKASFAVSNTNELIMKAVKRIVSEIIGREKRYRPLKYIHKQGTGNNKPTWNLNVCKVSELKMLAEALLPYLEGKKAQAELIVEYCSIPSGWLFENGVRVANQKVLEKRRDLAYKISWLNRHPGKTFSSHARDLTGSSLEEYIQEMKAKSELHGDVQSTAEMTVPA